MRVGRRNAGGILMALGIGFGLAYVLFNLYTLPSALMRFSGMLLYAGIVAILSGLVFYLLARTSRVS